MDPVATLRAAVADLAKLPTKPAFIIHTGYISHLSKPVEFDAAAEVMTETGLPVFYVPGEHEVLTDEGFFSIITRRRIRCGVFKSVADLQDAIARYIRRHNKNLRPFVWTKPAATILESSAASLHLLYESVRQLRPSPFSERKYHPGLWATVGSTEFRLWRRNKMTLLSVLEARVRRETSSD